MRIANRIKMQAGLVRYRLHGKQLPEMPLDWDEEAYFWTRPDVEQAVKAGRLDSGFHHWHLHGRYEMNEIEWPPCPWLRAEMRTISQIEPELVPSKAFLETLAEYRPMQPSHFGRLYAQLEKKIGQHSFTHVFLLPWVKRGGADLEALHHIRCLATDHRAKVLVILTENTDSPWLDRLPDSVVKLKYGNVPGEIGEPEAERLLARLLLRIQPDVIHNVNSAIGWRVFRRFGAALHSISKLCVSLFCFDYLTGGEPVGYATLLSEKVHEYLETVFVDNRAFADLLSNLYGVAPELFSVLHFPVRLAPRFDYKPAAGRPKILWAGRLDRQKRPDLLRRIAEALPECQFHVYGSALLDRSRELVETERALKRMRHVKMFGSFDGFDAIKTDNYAFLLYTTQWDGMPNIVLESLASGLPVLAPDVGGIGDVIPPESHFLIRQFDDTDEYVAMIRSLLAKPALIADERERALNLLAERYSWESFSADIGKLAFYSKTTAGPEKAFEVQTTNKVSQGRSIALAQLRSSWVPKASGTATVQALLDGD